MSEKYPGGFVTYNPPTPSQTSATGIWTLSQQEQYQQAGLWPNAPSQISRSLRFNSADSTYLTRTPAYAGNRTTWTWSAWVKRTNLTVAQYTLFGASVTNANYDEFRFNTSDQFRFFIVSSSSIVLDLITTQVFRDPSAWYHLVVAYDSTQATSSDRAKLYVNGVQVTSFGTATYPSQNQNTTINSNALTSIGLSQSGFLLNCYMANVQFVDGQALTPTSFGEYNANTGVWQPLQKNLTYGTNGFQLTFNDNSNTTATTLGADSSGNGNNWTPNNFSVTAGAGNDSLVDSPTSYGTDTGVGGEVRGNYATLNPLTFLNATFANGNLDAVVAVPETSNAVGTFGVSSGQWYWEVTPTTTDAGMIGVCDISASATNRSWQSANGWSYFKNGNKYNNNSGAAYGSSWVANDVIGVALDMDAGTLVFYKNGTSQGTAYSTGLTGKTITAYLGNGNGTGASQYYSINFGQRPFAYTAPSGFKALCTQNLPTPTIGATTATQAGKYFNPVLYTGNGASSRAVTGVGFQPDFVWLKARNFALVNGLFDAVRGGNKLLISNLTSAEITNEVNGYLSTFDSDGFTLTAGSTNNDTFNGSASSMVSWNWKANGSGVTNTSGSITSTVSANTTSGFSIVTYTATGSVATIGHGLGVAPSMVILKGRSGTTDWFVYHSSLGATNGIYLNQTGAQITSANFWNNTAPTSSVFTAGTGVGGSGVTMVAYCFAEVAGYSKFGSYTGNGSTNFIYTGFRPAYVLIRRTNVAAGWGIIDSSRNPYNSANIYLNANDSGADGVGTAGSQYVDLLSNGFKCLDASGGFNASGDNYIFMAFASAPFKYALAR